MRLLRAFVILTVLVALSVVHLAIYTNSIKISYEINDLKQQIDKLRDSNRYLNYLVAKEEALPRIEQIAKGRLNMIYPEKINYIIIATGEAK